MPPATEVFVVEGGITGLAVAGEPHRRGSAAREVERSVARQNNGPGPRPGPPEAGEAAPGVVVQRHLRKAARPVSSGSTTSTVSDRNDGRGEQK